VFVVTEFITILSAFKLISRVSSPLLIASLISSCDFETRVVKYVAVLLAKSTSLTLVIISPSFIPAFSAGEFSVIVITNIPVFSRVNPPSPIP